MAADFIAASDRLKVGDSRSPNADLWGFNNDVGKPLRPRAKASFLCITRRFFLISRTFPTGSVVLKKPGPYRGALTGNEHYGCQAPLGV